MKRYIVSSNLHGISAATIEEILKELKSKGYNGLTFSVNHDVLTDARTQPQDRYIVKQNGQTIAELLENKHSYHSAIQMIRDNAISDN